MKLPLIGKRPSVRAIRRFLLGVASDALRERIEVALISDRSFDDFVQMVEEELIDDFAAGQLPPDEQRHLEALLRSRPELVERIAFARAFESFSNGGSPRLHSTSSRRTSAGSSRASYPLLGGILLASLLILAGSGLYLARYAYHLESEFERLSSRTNESESTTGSPFDEQGTERGTGGDSVGALDSGIDAEGEPRASRRGDQTARPGASRPRLALVLPALRTRAESRPDVLVLLPSDVQIVIHIQLLSEENERYRAQMEDNAGNRVAVWTGLTVHLYEGVPTLRLPISAQKLIAAEYLLRLFAPEADVYEEIGLFRIRVEQQ